MKDPKVILDLALSFSDNMVKVLSDKLLNGNLTDEERTEIQSKLEDYNKAKEDLYAKLESTEETQKFSTADVDSRLLIVFAVMRKLIQSNPTVNCTEISSKLEEILPGSAVVIEVLQSKFNNTADDVQKAIYRNYLTQLASKQLNYLAEVKDIEYGIEDAFNLIEASIAKGTITFVTEEIVQFSSEKVGLGYIKSGLNFVIQMVNRMKESENPNKEEIDQYELGIKSVNKLISESSEDADEKVEENKTKLFSALTTLGVKTKLFTHAMSNSKFSEIMLDFGKDYRVTSISHEDEKDVYQVANDERTVEIVVNYNEESDVFSSILVDGVETSLDELEDMIESLLTSKVINTVEETTSAEETEETEEISDEPANQKEIVVDYDPEEDRVLNH